MGGEDGRRYAAGATRSDAFWEMASALANARSRANFFVA
jgi:hypothetical protein